MTRPADTDGAGEPRLDAALGRAILRAQEAADRTIREAEERARSIVADAEGAAASQRGTTAEVERLLRAIDEIEHRLVDRVEAMRSGAEDATDPSPAQFEEPAPAPARLGDDRFYAELRRGLSRALRPNGDSPGPG